ncbi:MAG: lytic transglycosylase domain-containing protein [Magnetococcales bacterium]|nr:lytic transglycosylase domain-containing protein [Magnetococcales bacterium]
MQAVVERNGLSGGSSLSPNSVNALVEAVVSALRQAKESMGPSPFLNLGGGGASGVDEGWAMNSQPADSFSQGVQAPTLRHIKTRAPADPGQKIPSTLEGGNYDQIIQRASDRYGVDPDLIRSVIKVESSFNPKAVSPAGAQGMMQLMPGTAKELGVKNPFNAEENIMGGTLYLSRLLDRYDGDVRSTLAAYNWGMGNLEKKPASAMPTETRRYVSRIMGMIDDKPTG